MSDSSLYQSNTGHEQPQDGFCCFPPQHTPDRAETTLARPQYPRVTETILARPQYPRVTETTRSGPKNPIGLTQLLPGLISPGWMPIREPRPCGPTQCLTGPDLDLCRPEGPNLPSFSKPAVVTAGRSCVGLRPGSALKDSNQKRLPEPTYAIKRLAPQNGRLSPLSH